MRNSLVALLWACTAACTTERPPEDVPESVGTAAGDSVTAGHRLGCGDPAHACFALAYSGENGTPFLGRYRAGRFIDDTPNWAGDNDAYNAALLRVARRFPRNVTLPAVSTSGITTSIVIDSVVKPSGDLYESLLAIRTDASAENLFAWTPNVVVDWLKPAVVQLDADLFERLRADALGLYRQAQKSRGGAISVEFGKPISHSIAGEHHIAVFLPVVIRWSETYVDDRASVFFIVDLDGGNVVYKTFGHPEWSPDAEGVQTVRPLMYFRIRSNRATYFLADYRGAWEDMTFAIVELRTGRAVLQTY